MNLLQTNQLNLLIGIARGAGLSGKKSTNSKALNVILYIHVVVRVYTK